MSFFLSKSLGTHGTLSINAIGKGFYLIAGGLATINR